MENERISDIKFKIHAIHIAIEHLNHLCVDLPLYIVIRPEQKNFSDIEYMKIYTITKNKDFENTNPSH